MSTGHIWNICLLLYYLYKRKFKLIFIVLDYWSFKNGDIINFNHIEIDELGLFWSNNLAYLLTMLSKPLFMNDGEGEILENSVSHITILFVNSILNQPNWKSVLTPILSTSPWFKPIREQSNLTNITLLQSIRSLFKC